MAAAVIKTNAEAHKLVTEEHVTEALTKDKGNGAKYKKFEIIDFCRKGDNYLCFVTSVEVTYMQGSEEKSVTYVAKLNLVSPLESFQAFTASAFYKESKFYLAFVPATNEVLESLNLPPLKFATCYTASLEPRKQIIFLDDMRSKGFRMADRTADMDDCHVLIVVKELARLHAASTLLEDNLGPQAFRETYNFFDDILGSGAHPAITRLFKVNFFNYMTNAARIAAQFQGYENIAASLNAMAPSTFDIYKENTRDCDPKFRVVNHGDCWTNNLLFRYDNGKVVDACLLDVQVCRQASLALDLVNFFYTSLTGHVRRKGLTSYLTAYYSSFKEVYDIAGKNMLFTFDELYEEYLDKLVFGLIMTSMLMPIDVMQSIEVFGFSDYSEDDRAQMVDDYHRQVLKLLDTSSNIRPRLLDMFDEMAEHGIL